MANPVTVEHSDGFEESSNFTIDIPGHVWAVLNDGETWIGTEADGEVSSSTLKLGKVTIRVTG